MYRVLQHVNTTYASGYVGSWRVHANIISQCLLLQTICQTKNVYSAFPCLSTFTTLQRLERVEHNGVNILCSSLCTHDHSESILMSTTLSTVIARKSSTSFKSLLQSPFHHSPSTRNITATHPTINTQPYLLASSPIDAIPLNNAPPIPHPESHHCRLTSQPRPNTTPLQQSQPLHTPNQRTNYRNPTTKPSRSVQLHRAFPPRTH
jgi:hypothetical protein